MPQEPAQPSLATPVLVSGILYSRYVDVENLLHREGFITGAAYRPAAQELLQAVVQSLGHDSSLSLEHGTSLVIPLTGRRDISTALPLPIPAPARLAECLQGIAQLLLGSLCSAHPHCLLAAKSPLFHRTSCSLLAELMAPKPSPRIPACATLALAHSKRASSRGAPAAATLTSTAAGSPRGWASSSSGSGSGSGNGSAAARGGECLVTLDEVLAFVFPPRSLHPRSMARLILYALRGPLQGGALVGGRLALARPLSEREVEAELDALEVEDVLGAYTGGSVLGGSTEPVLHSVRMDGGLSMPTMSREQVVALLQPVAQATAAAAAAAAAAAGGGASASASASATSPSLLPSSPLLSFHSLQACVLAARGARVEGMRHSYPPAIQPLEAPGRLLPAPPLMGRSLLAPQLQATLQPLASLEGVSRRGPHSSRECWAKESTIARAAKVDMLLHTRLQQVAPIWGTQGSAQCSSLIANTILMRDTQGLPGAPAFAAESVFALQRSRGTYCPSTKDVSSSLPLKRLERQREAGGR